VPSVCPARDSINVCRDVTDRSVTVYISTEALPDLLRSLLEQAKDMMWAFVPEQWQYVHAESPEEKVDSMDIIRTYIRPLLCALRGGDPYTAAAVCFLLDRPMYWSGNSRSLLHLVRALRHHAPTAPQLVIRQARLYLNAGQLQKAEFILNSLIENKGETGTWKYREDKDRTLVQAVCVQIHGQVLQKLGLWLEAAEFFLLSIIGFQALHQHPQHVPQSTWKIRDKIMKPADFIYNLALCDSHLVVDLIRFFLCSSLQNRCGSCLLSYSQLPDCPSSERETCIRQAADAFEVSILTSLRGVGEAPSRQQLHAFILAAFGQAVTYREMGREEVEGETSATDRLTKGPEKDSDGVVKDRSNNITNNSVEEASNRKACLGLDSCADLLKRLRLASSDTGSVMEEAAAVVWQAVRDLAKTIDERRHRRSDTASCMPDRYIAEDVNKILLYTDNFGAIMREQGAKFRVLKSKELSNVGHSIFTVVATTEYYSGGPKAYDGRSTPMAENESSRGVQVLKGESDHQATGMDSDPFSLIEGDKATKVSQSVLANNLSGGLKELDLNRTSKIVGDDREHSQKNAVWNVGVKEYNTQLIDANAETAPSEEWCVLEERERVVQPLAEIVNLEEIDDSLRGSQSSSSSSWVKVSSLHLSSSSSFSKPIPQRTAGSQGSGSFEMIAVVLKYSIQSETWLGQETLLHVGERLPLPKRLMGNQRETFWIHYLHQDEPQGRYVGKCYRKVKMGHYYVDNVLRQSKAQYYITEFNKRLVQQDILTQIFYLPATLLLVIQSNRDVWGCSFEGSFVKLSNNTTVCKKDLPATRYGMAFSHFTYNMSLAQELIVDLQGSYCHSLLLQLHTALKLDNSMDHGLKGFENFWKHQHPVCSDICVKLGLQRGNVDTA
uniref:Alpha-type protein kinase domain-containing protein n=1 Tax=Eptatretus burgeri TaxID=7764 RepID=A0A8C4QT70_EPTBU